MGWVVLHGHVVHVDVHGEVMLWVTTDSAWSHVVCQKLWSIYMLPRSQASPVFVLRFVFSTIHRNGRAVTAVPLHTKPGGGLGTRLECMSSAESVWHVGVPIML